MDKREAEYNISVQIDANLLACVAELYGYADELQADGGELAVHVADRIRRIVHEYLPNIKTDTD